MKMRNIALMAVVMGLFTGNFYGSEGPSFRLSMALTPKEDGVEKISDYFTLLPNVGQSKKSKVLLAYESVNKLLDVEIRRLAPKVIHIKMPNDKKDVDLYRAAHFIVNKFAAGKDIEMKEGEDFPGFVVDYNFSILRKSGGSVGFVLKVMKDFWEMTVLAENVGDGRLVMVSGPGYYHNNFPKEEEIKILRKVAQKDGFIEEKFPLPSKYKDRFPVPSKYKDKFPQPKSFWVKEGEELQKPLRHRPSEEEFPVPPKDKDRFPVPRPKSFWVKEGEGDKEIHSDYLEDY